ncbi:MAG: hypothetical protein M3N47_12285 [Chloroflexota bacterium]|nr:hypothetical protein [Chloroflexota bacterium]
MTARQSANDGPLLRRTTCIERSGDGAGFEAVDGDARFGELCAALWATAVRRALALGADEPSALSVESRSGAVVAVRDGDRVLMGVVAEGVPPSAARYALERRLER